MARSAFATDHVRKLLAACARHQFNLNHNEGSFSDNLSELKRKQRILASYRTPAQEIAA